MEPGDEKEYYSVLGLGKNAPASAIKSAYRKLAMKWHPDKCSIQDTAEAKVKFQEIQEAYAVLSDERKKVLYDNGLYDPEDDDEDIEGFSSFMNEMSGMMADVRASEDSGKGSSFEELQQLFVSMFSADLASLNNQSTPTTSFNMDKKRGWRGEDYDSISFFESCIMGDNFSSSESHFFFGDSFNYGNNMDSNASKKTKNTVHGSSTANGSHANH